MEKSSFFNSNNGDRKYKAQDFAEYFNSFITNGVFPNPSANLQVLSNNNMTVTLKSGKAWINGYIYINTDDLILPIAVADGVLNRIDRIVVQYNTIDRTITCKVKKGVFASIPVAPVLQRDADAYELGIADIAVSKGITTIVQANVTDLRMNTTYCGWVNSLIQADTTAIFNQYQNWYTAKQNSYDIDFATWINTKKSTYDNWYNTTIALEQNQIDTMEAQFQNDFTTWFNSIKNTLGTDVAGSLLNEINNLTGVGRTTETIKANADAIAILNGTGTVVEKANKSDLTTLNNMISIHEADSTKHVGSVLYLYNNIGGTL